MRRIDEKFHVEGGEIVKSTSGELIPHDEPLLLLRGRDHLALAAVEHYVRLCELEGCNDWQMEGIRREAERFRAFAEEHPERMKQPGITRGAAWATTSREGQAMSDATVHAAAERAAREVAAEPGIFNTAGVLNDHAYAVCCYRRGHEEGRAPLLALLRRLRDTVAIAEHDHERRTAQAGYATVQPFVLTEAIDDALADEPTP